MNFQDPKASKLTQGEHVTSGSGFSARLAPSRILRLSLFDRIVRIFDLGQAHVYWLFPACCGLYLIFGAPNDPEFGLSVFAAALACGIPILVAQHSYLSFLTVIAFTHVFSYPLAAVIGMTLTNRAAAIEDYLWDTTPYAMWACVVGMVGLSVGGVMANRVWLSRTRPTIELSELPGAFSNFLLVSLLLPIVTFEIYQGYYYHSAVTGVEAYNWDGASQFGFIGYFSWLALAGTVLQIRRYTITRTWQDLAYVLITILIPLVAYLPSGSRIRAFTTIPLVAISFLSWEKRVKVKRLVIISCLALFVILTPLVDAYRNSASSGGAVTFTKQIELLMDYGTQEADETAPQQKRVLFARRLADYVGTGQVISVVPSVIGYRYFVDMDQWWAFLIPTLLRPTVTLVFTDGAIAAADYGVRPENPGSSPIMVLGDLFSRFGWPGVFLGMALIGLLLRRLDFWLQGSGLFGLILFSILVQGVIALYASSLLVTFVFFTRNLLVMVLLALAAAWILRRNSKHG